MTDNLALWKSVEKTDPKHVKPITGKSYQGTSPKPHYLIHKATETFGPIGIGWGFTIENERIEEGAGGERMHIARVKVWFKWGGERGEVEHIGGTQFSGLRSSGKPFTDEDAPKKSVTDALVKALSMIGFAGDIFMGRYDDSKYVNDLKAEAAEAERAPSKAAIRDDMKRFMDDLRTAENKIRLKAVWDDIPWDRIPKDWVKTLTQEKDDALRRITDAAVVNDFPGDIPPTPNQSLDRLAQEAR